MDGSYNQPFGRSQSPMSPQTPQTPSSSYQVNVSRQKTRKWVEAKVQNYDGDDWGGDDYDEPEEPVPAVPAKDPRPAVTSRLPSESRAPRPSSIHVPSSLSVAPASSTSSAGPTPPPSGLPSLQDETKQNTAITAASQPPPRALTSPPLPESPALGGAHGRPFPVSPQNPVAQRDRAEPGIATRVADDQPPLPPPKDTLPPLPVGSEDNSVQRILLQDGPAPLSQPTSAQPQQAADEPALATAADINRDETSGSPQLPNVSRLSSFGIEFSLARPEATPSFDRDTMEPSAPTQTKPDRSEPSSAFAPPPVVSDVPTPDTTEQAPIESPALPPVPQQSTNTELGARQEAPADKAGTSPDPIPDTPEAPQQGRITRPSLPGGWVTETPSVPEQTRGMDDDGGKVESEEVSRITQPEHRANLSSQAQGSNGSDPRTLPPLITPSSKQEGPNGPFAHAEATVSSASPGPGPAHASGTPKTASSDIPPTQPLQPQKHWHSPVGHDLQPVQTQTTYSTVTSSPEKESDLLRDEIIRSLTPRHEVPPTTIPVEDQEVQAGVRDSTYSLSGYDAYWADTTTRDGTRDKTTDTKQAPLPDPTIEPDRNDSIVAPLSPIKSPNTKLSEPTSDERKRFSWEMESQAQREKQTPEKPDDDRSTTAAKVEESSQAPAVVSVESGEVKPAVRDHEVPKPDAQLTGLAPVSHQVSKASTNPPTAANPQSPEPPSPISMASEKPTAQAATQRQPAPVKEETSSWAAPPQHQPVPPAEASEVTPPAPPPPASKTLPPTFKDIMGRPSSAERIAKFDETRETFATLDSGLGHWISAVKSQHAEHTNVTSSFHAANGPAQNQATSTTPGHAPTPQPYYQQYINASSQAVNSPGAGRGRVGGPAGPGQGNSSSFGPSSNQIGTKSKEFMQSAGKKGMGLLHKGRNKLRGTGDKVFH